MKPALPPSVVRLLCLSSMDAVADKLGVSARTLYRYVERAEWGDWNVQDAIVFCNACGLDFWNLTIPASRAALARIDWDPGDPHVARALTDLQTLAGVPSTKESRTNLARTLQTTLRNGGVAS